MILSPQITGSSPRLARDPSARYLRVIYLHLKSKKVYSMLRILNMIMQIDSRKMRGGSLSSKVMGMH